MADKIGRTARPARSPVIARSRVLLPVTVLAATLISVLTMVGLPGSGAQFSDDLPIGADISAGRIFRDERITPAFIVSDRSSGAVQSGTSANAFANDGRYFLTRDWPTSFDADRYIELEFNTPLPGGLAVGTATANVQLSSDAGTGSVCVYFELRRVSTGALVSSHGSPASPLACTSGISATTLSVSLAAVGATDLANDLRLRLYARDSAAGAIRLDEATIGGATPYAAFTLYPILTREQFNGQTELLRWGLAGP